MAFALCILTITSLSAMQKQPPRSIRAGQNINEAIQVMAQAGLKEGMGVEIATFNKNIELTGWPVTNGHLVAAFSNVDGRIKSLTLYMDQDRPKSERTNDLVFEVNAYAPATGQTLMIVPNSGMKVRQQTTTGKGKK